MSVANPWIVRSPAPLMSHSLDGFPGSEFSHTIGFVTGGSHAVALLWIEAMRTGGPLDPTLKTGKSPKGRDASSRSASNGPK